MLMNTDDEGISRHDMRPDSVIYPGKVLDNVSLVFEFISIMRK